VSWLFVAINVYIFYYTITYAVKLYKNDKNKLGGIMAFIVAILLIALPLLIRFKVIGSE
jgi:hypothetical protein